MKRSRALILATTLGVSAAFVGGASAAGSIRPLPAPAISGLSVGGGGGEDDGGSLPGGKVAHGTIGSALPNASAVGSLRGLGGDGGGEDDGGALPGGKVAHGTIGHTAPSAKAAGNLRALGGTD